MRDKPQNEQGVVVEFAQRGADNGFEIVSIQTAFPDAIVSKDGVEYRAEFEYKASSFKAHGHDIRKADLIICWENDWPDCILPIIDVSYMDFWNFPLDLPSGSERELVYWQQRALLAERINVRLGNRISKFEHVERDYSDFVPRWGSKDEFFADSGRPLDLRAVDLAEMADISLRSAQRWLKQDKDAGTHSDNGKE